MTEVTSPLWQVRVSNMISQVSKQAMLHEPAAKRLTRMDKETKEVLSWSPLIIPLPIPLGASDTKRLAQKTMTKVRAQLSRVKFASSATDVPLGLKIETLREVRKLLDYWLSMSPTIHGRPVAQPKSGATAAG
jgi:hypothetical protein